MFVQEHRAEGAKLAELSRQVRKEGWSAAFSPAQHTGNSEEGLSGGTAILVRGGLALTEISGLPADFAWPPGHRFTLRCLNAVVPGGLLVGSAYMTAGIGFTGPNLQYLDVLGQLLVAMRRPFIIGGDFNLARGFLHDSGWLTAVGALVVGPPETEPTCMASAKGSCIDYFLVSAGLGPDVARSFVEQRPTVIRTHRPVYLDIAAADRGRTVQTLRRPKALPVRPIIGPTPFPPAYHEAAEAARCLAEQTTTQMDLDVAFGAWAATAEAEVLANFDCAQDAAFQGRIGEPTFVWTLATPKSRPTPKGGGEAELWHWLADRLRQLRGLVQTDLRQSAHAKGLRRRMSRLKWPFATAGDQPELWQWWLRWRRSLWKLSALQLQVLEQSFGRAAADQERAEAAARANRWRAWARDIAMADGARLAHRWTKPPPVWAQPPRTASGEAMRPQEFAEATAEPWHLLWRVGQARAAHSMLNDMDPEVAEQPLLAAPSIDEIRNVCATFSRFTAIGVDNMHPKHVGRLSEEGPVAHRHHDGGDQFWFSAAGSGHDSRCSVAEGFWGDKAHWYCCVHCSGLHAMVAASIH